MSKEIELRLIDAPVPDGEIIVKDLAALTTALQELTTRIGREVINSPGQGRTKQFMEEFAQLRLRSVEAGSTVLVFSKGPTDKLDVDVPEQQVADDRFWEIVKAIAEDQRPEWVTDLIAESAGRLVDALQVAAPKAVLRGPSRDDVAIDSAHIHAEIWSSKRLQTGTVMTAKGRLEKVDLRSHEFRVRDDVGQAVDLKHVEDDVSVALFVGQWVVARGTGILLSSGRLVALDNAVIEPVTDPASSLPEPIETDLQSILASAPGPNPDGGVDVSDEEFDAFLEALRS